MQDNPAGGAGHSSHSSRTLIQGRTKSVGSTTERLTFKETGNDQVELDLEYFDGGSGGGGAATPPIARSFATIPARVMNEVCKEWFMAHPEWAKELQVA